MKTEQIREIELAGQIGGDPCLLEQHPEWSSILMNVVTNRIKEGMNYQKIVNFLERYEDKKEFVGEDYMLTIQVARIEEEGYLELVEQGIVTDKCTVAELLWTECGIRYHDHDRLESGRISITGIDDRLHILSIMSEGIKEVQDLLEKLQSVSRDILKEQIPPDMMFGHLVPGVNLLLSLDDMHMRGNQVIDAYTYVGGDKQKLVQLISDRDTDMILYVNKCAAERFRNGSKKEYVAVRGGASSLKIGKTQIGLTSDRPDLVVSDCNVNQYLIDIEPVFVDYSSMDIVQSTESETGLKIAEFHGFHKVFEKEYTSAYGDKVTSIIMYNPETKDILEAGMNRSGYWDSFCYGGATIYAARENHMFSDWRRGYNSNQFTDNSATVYEITYHDGLFAGYAPFLGDKIVDLDYSKYPIESLVIPSYVSDSYFFQIGEKINTPMSYWLNRESYTITSCINYILFVQDINELTDDVKKIYSRILDDPYNGLAEKTYIYQCNADVASALIRLAFAYTGIKKREQKKYAGAIINSLVKWNYRDASVNEKKDKAEKLLRECEWAPTQQDYNILKKIMSE